MLTPYATSPSEKGEWDITLKEMMAINEAMITHYATWLRNAPDEYKDLTELKDSVPTAIVVRYGQNREIDTGEAVTERANREYWQRSVNYRYVSRIEFGLAQQLRSVVSCPVVYIIHSG